MTTSHIIVGSSIDVDRAHADPLFVLMEGHGDGCFVVGNSRKDRLRASILQQFSLNFSHFVARTIWRKRGVSPRRGKAHRLHRRESLRCVLVPMATPLRPATNCEKLSDPFCEPTPEIPRL